MFYVCVCMYGVYVGSIHGCLKFIKFFLHKFCNMNLIGNNSITVLKFFTILRRF